MGTKEKPINIATLDKDGRILFKNYTGSDIGQCLDISTPGEDQSGFWNFMMYTILSFAFVVIFLGMVCICRQPKLHQPPDTPEQGRQG